MHQLKPKEKDFNPPAWFVFLFSEIKLDKEVAEKFQALRTKLCSYLGKGDESCGYNTLFNKAIKILIENESALLTKVEYDIYKALE
jgi:hypothetical protein